MNGSSDIAEPLPFCRTCNYLLRGIALDSCPECGTDLTQQGAIRYGDKIDWAWMFRLLAWVGAWTAALLIVTVLLTVLLDRTVLPVHETRRLDRTLAWPQSQAYGGINFMTDYTTIRWPFQPHGATPPYVILRVENAPRSNPDSLVVHFHEARYEVHRTDGTVADRASRVPTLEDFAHWWQQVGLDPSDPQIRLELLETLDMLGRLQQSTQHLPDVIHAQSEFLSTTGGGASSTFYFGRLILLALWPLVWVIGMWWIWRRARRGL